VARRSGRHPGVDIRPVDERVGRSIFCRLTELPGWGGCHLASVRRPHGQRTELSTSHNAAANPCPCGHLGDSRFACRCSLYDLHRYASRLSGPLLDRIDLYVQAERLTAEELTDAADAEPTAPVRARVLAARARQRTRQGAENGRLASADVAAQCRVVPAARRTLMSAVDRLGLSARGFHRALRVARTVADLADSDRVEDEHLREALTLRHLPIIGAGETQLI
jgi:predicted ATPase with chaperone activity